VKLNVKEFTETSVTFENGREEDIGVNLPHDILLLSFSKNDSTGMDNHCSIVKLVFPRQLGKSKMILLACSSHQESPFLQQTPNLTYKSSRV
jgi:hypothetical protein